MKRFRLLTAALLLASAVSAQNGARQVAATDYRPTVYLIAVRDVEQLSPGEWRSRAVQNRMAMESAIADYAQTHRTGFQQPMQPLFVFANKHNHYSFAIGGYVALRAGYDFGGSPDNIDFVPSAIPVPGNYASCQKLMMDASTSRIYFKGIANTRALGRVLIYFDTDFRGGTPGESYTPRLRSAYISFKGLTFGRDATTFCDLDAVPETIDFQGPNSYNFHFATMIRYEIPFADNHFRFGVAAELPSVSGTYDEAFLPIAQRVPDFPLYFQWAWGAKRDSHLRLTGVLRDLYLHNAVQDTNTSLLGWGVQGSARIAVTRMLTLYGQGVYGEGISRYIQDLAGRGYDFTPDPDDPLRVQTMPMYSWFAGAQVHLIPGRLSLAGGYSEAHVARKHGAFADDEYRKGQYVFGNLFYNLTQRCQIAAEYLYGQRHDMDGRDNHANRINLLLKYNF